MSKVIKNIKLNRALFLDRDGIINLDNPYVHKKEDFEFIDGVFDLCRHAKELGFLIFVITNQAGIGRGYYTEEDFLKLTDWMCRVFYNEGIEISKVYYCPFHPEHGIGDYKKDSYFRKPAPGMILQAINEFNVDVLNSVLIGNKITDIQAGISAGLKTNILYENNQENCLNQFDNTILINNLDQAKLLL